MRRCTSRLLGSLGLFALGALVTPAHGDTIFSTFGPANSYNVAAVDVCAGAGCSGSFQRVEIGAGFTAPTFTLLGGPFALDSISLALSQLTPTQLAQAGLPRVPNEVSVSLRLDSGGLPGPILETFTFNGALGPFGSTLNPPLVASSLLRPILAQGSTYWVTVSTPGSLGRVEWNEIVGPPTQGKYAEKINSDAWRAPPIGALTATSVSGTPLTKQDAFAAVISGAVSHPSVSGAQISTTFQPNFGFTLAAAASLGGFDHFNWYQIAEIYPGLFCTTDGSGNIRLPVVSPFRDPPNGGCNGQLADNLPFYWDEGLLSGFDLRANISNVFGDVDCSRTPPNPDNAFILCFQDLPEDKFIGITPFGDYMQFYTSLVGVRSDGTWKPLDTFTWKSDYSRGHGGILARNLTPVPGATGSVFDVQELPNALDVPPDVLRLWREDGGIVPNVSGVPGPPTIALLGTGLLLICVVSRWAKRRS